jgi:tetratricopeptide (TPR) repeat protein
VGYFYQRTRKAWRAAIGRYEQVLRDYPDYEKLDEVLFRLGEALAATLRFKEALPVLSRLKEEYPESRWIPKADEILAEMPDMSDIAPPAVEPAGPPPPRPPTPRTHPRGPDPDPTLAGASTGIWRAGTPARGRGWGPVSGRIWMNLKCHFEESPKDPLTKALFS